MTTTESRELFAYTVWANGLIFAAAAALPEERLNRPIVSSFPSVHLTLGHMVGAEWVWMRRWHGENPTSFPEWVAKPVLSDLRARLTAIEQERDVFLAGLTDADLAKEIDYRALGGQPNRMALSDLIRHVVNHATYHRGQVTTMLRQLDQKPPSTDVIVYLRMRA